MLTLQCGALIEQTAFSLQTWRSTRSIGRSARHVINARNEDIRALQQQQPLWLFLFQLLISTTEPKASYLGHPTCNDG